MSLVGHSNAKRFNDKMVDCKCPCLKALEQLCWKCNNSDSL